MLKILFSALLSGLLGAPTYAHEGTPNVDAREICAPKSLGDACEWNDAHDALYIGSCRLVSESLLCVRNKPIVYPEGKNKADHNEADHK